MFKAVKLGFVATSLALCGAQAFAKTQDLGVVTVAGTTFSNTFYSAQSFSDYYTFTIGGTDSGVQGTTVETSYRMFVSREVDINSLTLTDLTTGQQVGMDTSASSFSFSGLTAGDQYQLTVSGAALSGFLSGTSGSYSGTIQAVASSAPEASDVLLSGMGLAAVALMLRRRRA